MPRDVFEDQRRKERRNRWIRWTIAALLAGGGAVYAADRMRDAEAEIDDLELRVVGDSIAAVTAAETILALGIRVEELSIVAVESIPVPGPIRWRTRIDSFPVPGPERIKEIAVACPVCPAIDSSRIFELERTILEIRDRPPPDPIEIRVVEVRRAWWEYILVAGVAGIGGYLIGDRDESPGSTSNEKDRQDDEDG